MSKCRIVEEIRKLNIPARAKAELMMLWYKARRLVEAMLRFIERHKEFAEAMILGAIIACLLSHIPWLGGFLALLALVTAAAIGVLNELREDLSRLFEPIEQQA